MCNFFIVVKSVHEKLNSWLLDKIWQNASEEAYDIVAKAMGYEICDFCWCAILPNRPHESCQQQLKERQAQEAAEELEIEEYWAAYNQQLEEQEQEAFDNEICPCGHSRSEHNDYFSCQSHGCHCPEFGEPTENWEEPETFTEVNLGGSPGGFTIYE